MTIWSFVPPEGYISQTMKLGALGLPAYRTFSLEELEEATNNFDTSAFMGEGSQGQVCYSGIIYIWCLLSCRNDAQYDSSDKIVFSLCVIRSKNGKGKVGPAFLYTSHISCLQMYRGRLKNGTFVAIRCLKMKKSHSTRNFMHHIELISKLRHRHLVSALGHCFECYFDDSSVSRIFLIFEYVPNGTLRSWISGNSWKSLIRFSGWRI